MTFKSRRTSTRRTDQTDLHAGMITRLAYQKNDPQRVSVYIDDSFALGVHVDIIIRYGIRKGMELDVESQEDMLQADSVYRARNVALKYLAHKQRTSVEVERRLGENGFSDATIAAVVGSLNDSGMLDDERYAREYAGARFSGRGYGPDRIKLELLKRGIEKNLAEQSVADVISESDVLETALEHARKAWDRAARETDQRKRRKKVYDYLLRRGFDFDTAQTAVDRLGV